LSEFGDCLSAEEMLIFQELTKLDKAWLKLMGWKPPHEYVLGCISNYHCGICQSCSCDFGLYQ
jgi:hypothetical protein